MKESRAVYMGGVIALTAVASIYLVVGVWGCNEAVCASIVSKCTLTQACKCTLTNCTCCRECFDCLTYLYDECCSCLGKATHQKLCIYTATKSTRLILSNMHAYITKFVQICRVVS